MGRNNVRNKVSSLLIISMLVCSGVFLLMPSTPLSLDVAAATTWTETSNTDFNKGTLNNTEIDGSGAAAELLLRSDFSGNWTEKPRGTIPSARRGHVLSSISGTGEILLFGGYDGSPMNDTWIYNLSSDKWTNMNPSGNPPSSRYSHAMAPLHGTKKVLLFGGYTVSGVDNETWVYDASTNTWTNKNPPGAKPEAREYHGLASIYNDDKVVLFGGYGAKYYNDTWEYDLNANTWTNKNPQLKPSARKDPGMATIHGTKNIIVFGGNESGINVINDTWEYNLSKNQWTKKTPTGDLPNARRGHALTEIHGTDKILLFGTDDQTDNQTWIYDSKTNTWTQKSPPIKPSARYIIKGISSIHGTDQVVLFGGMDSVNRDDTWAYDLNDNNWTKKTPSLKPSKRRGHVMSPIYDTAEVLLFGGYQGGDLGDTWTYNLSSDKWTSKNPSISPSDRYSSAMASIHGTDKVLLFGGYSGGSVDNETWVYDLSNNTWTKKSPTLIPEAREYHALASIYDDDKVILFSGYNGTGYINDTWVYDLSADTWTKKSPSTAPSGRKGHEMANVYGIDKIVLFGGNESGIDVVNDTWVYDLSADTWTQKSPAIKPSARRGHGMVAIDGTDKVMIFGADDQTWLYDLSDNKWSQQTLSTKPSARYITHGIALVYGTDKAVLFGGGKSTGDLEDTWVYDAIKYVKSGTYVSSAFDTGGSSSFMTIKWNATMPTGTSIKFQLCTAGTKSGLSTTNFTGPGGNTTKYYLTSPSNLWSGHSGDRWVQYKAYLSTSDEQVTPRVQDISITYNNLPQMMLSSPINGEATSNNKPNFNWDFIDTVGDSQTAFQVIIDNDFNFESIDYESGEQSSALHSWQFPVGTSYTTIPDGSWYWKVRTKDTHGDWGEFSIPWSFTIDTIVPESMLTMPEDHGVYNSLASISGSASDTLDGTGISRVEIAITRLIDDYYWSGSAWVPTEKWLIVSGTTKWTYESYSIQFSSGTEYKVRSRAIDYAENTESASIGNVFIYDSVKPISIINTPADETWLNELHTISGICIDFGGAGIAIVEISIECPGENTYWSGTTWSSDECWLSAFGTDTWVYDSSNVIWATDTHYVIRSRTIDNAGNVELLLTENNIMIDNSAPAGLYICIDAGAEYINSVVVSLSLQAADHGSRVSQMSFSTDAETWTAWEPFSHESAFTLTAGDGEKIIYFRVQDRACNIAEPVFNTIKLDTTPPESVSILINEGAEFTNSKEVTLTLEALDLSSGLEKMSFSTDGDTWTNWERFASESAFTLPAGDGEKVIYFRVMDKVGNIASASDTIKLDTTPPDSLSILINNGDLETDSTSVILTLTAHDDGSGVYKMSFSNDGRYWSDWEPFSGERAFTLPPQAGEKTFFFRVKDRASNIAEPASAKIILKTSEQIPDTDGDGYFDDSDAFPTDPAASVDLDMDNSPDHWNVGKSAADSTTGLHLDAFPDDPAASVDTDEDGYPNEWNPDMSEKDSTTGLQIDEFPDNAKLFKKSDESDKPFIELSSIAILVIILVIIIIITSVVFRSSRQRTNRQFGDNKILRNLRNGIVSGTSSTGPELSSTELKALYETNYQKGELGEETFEIINNIIEELD